MNHNFSFDLREGVLAETRPEGEAARAATALEREVEELFVALRDPVYRYARRLIGAAAEAEEITQEAFLRLYDHLRQEHAVANARAWRFRTAHNLAVDQLRQRSRMERESPAE